jgi:hypothetical protein
MRVDARLRARSLWLCVVAAAAPAVRSASSSSFHRFSPCVVDFLLGERRKVSLGSFMFCMVYDLSLCVVRDVSLVCALRLCGRNEWDKDVTYLCGAKGA